MYTRTYFLAFVYTFLSLCVIIFVRMLFRTYIHTFLRIFVTTYESAKLISHESM